MIILNARKQPWERKDYDADYQYWLADSDFVLSATATVACITSPTDTALTIEVLDIRPSVVKTWLSGGTDKAKYKITIRALTNAGRGIECEIVIAVKDD